ncbi:unnamed protein product [Staurois parvus]|uniref:Uncharacterized protein n=1 Tax=Staurois parvus TaxID=386267 RepID=A0ABN9DPZ4_9NEOB|nr:unnamed protein product [Staurois parvus]
MQGPGRAEIVNAGSGETGYSECGVQGDQIYTSSFFFFFFLPCFSLRRFPFTSCPIAKTK